MHIFWLVPYLLSLILLSFLNNTIPFFFSFESCFLHRRHTQWSVNCFIWILFRFFSFLNIVSHTVGTLNDPLTALFGLHKIVFYTAFFFELTSHFCFTSHFDFSHASTRLFKNKRCSSLTMHGVHDLSILSVFICFLLHWCSRKNFNIPMPRKRFNIDECNLEQCSIVMLLFLSFLVLQNFTIFITSV